MIHLAAFNCKGKGKGRARVGCEVEACHLYIPTPRSLSKSIPGSQASDQTSGKTNAATPSLLDATMMLIFSTIVSSQSGTEYEALAMGGLSLSLPVYPAFPPPYGVHVIQCFVQYQSHAAAEDPPDVSTLQHSRPVCWAC